MRRLIPNGQLAWHVHSSTVHVREQATRGAECARRVSIDTVGPGVLSLSAATESGRQRFMRKLASDFGRGGRYFGMDLI